MTEEQVAGRLGGPRSVGLVVMEQGPVIVVEGWTVDLAAEHYDLVAQHDDLEVFSSSGTNCERSQRSDEEIQTAVA